MVAGSPDDGPGEARNTNAMTRRAPGPRQFAPRQAVHASAGIREFVRNVATVPSAGSMTYRAAVPADWSPAPTGSGVSGRGREGRIPDLRMPHGSRGRR